MKQNKTEVADRQRQPEVGHAILKQDVAHAGGFYPTMKKGTIVRVADASNQPDWQEKRLVFIDQPGCGCEILVSLNEGII